MPIGTAHMARLCLPNAELHVGVTVAEMPSLMATLTDPSRPAALLYPGEDAVDLLSDPPRGPLTLVVVDGTWAQARKLVRLNPELAALPRYAFRAPTPSEYRIRKEPSVEVVSTIECLAQALGVIEGDEERFRALLVPFRAMVDAQITCQQQAPKRRTRHRVGVPGRAPVPLLELRRRVDDLVCVVAEGNVWPHDSPERQLHASELVQWRALRYTTGEQFEAIVRPNGPLAPRTSVISGVGVEDIHRGLSGAALGERFAAFLRPADQLCVWGRNGLALYEGMTGRPAGEVVDLRHLVAAIHHLRLGSLSEVAAATGRLGPPLGEGRSGRNLAAVRAVLEGLLEGTEPPLLPPVSALTQGAASAQEVR